jgi:lipid A ethanolaminephosphotransferase
LLAHYHCGMNFFKPKKLANPLYLSASVCLWLVITANVGFWKSVQSIAAFDSPKQWLFGICLAFTIFGLHWFVCCLFSFHRIVKWWLSLELVVAAICSYFMLTYGIVIDEGMIINSLQTDAREVRDLLNIGMVLSLALIALPGLVFVWRTPLVKNRFLSQTAMNIGGAVLSIALFLGGAFAMFQDFSALMRNNTTLRFQITPLNAFWGFGLAVTEPWRRGTADGKLIAIGADAKQSIKAQSAAKPKLIVYIVGETARSANFSLNGYARNTNPKLVALTASDNLVSFSEVASCGTATAASLPCMFSALGREQFLVSKGNQEGLLDVLNKAGIRQLWRNNNSGCKGVCDRIPTENMLALSNQTLCNVDNSSGCFDEILLLGLKEKLANLSAKPTNTMITLHQMGSHGPAYYQRSPKAFKQFTPECTTNQLAQCTRDEIVNAYDNTITYTDHVIAQSIEMLKSLNAIYDTALVYVSDHGESLGEGGTYLHGLPFAFAPKVQKHVPLIVWLSEPFSTRMGIDRACLQGSRAKPISHDNLFHSMLFLNEIETSLYRIEQNLFAQCIK